MKKGIFWCYEVYFDDDMVSPVLITKMVSCDIDGNPLEQVEFSSKSGDNFNHKIEWAKNKECELTEEYPYNAFPRGRVEIKNGTVKVFANPILHMDEIKKKIVDSFELTDVEDEIKWIADNSSHYKYLFDAMGGELWDKDLREWIEQMADRRKGRKHKQ